jgi:hypothetical protein
MVLENGRYPTGGVHVEIYSVQPRGIKPGSRLPLDVPPLIRFQTTKSVSEIISVYSLVDWLIGWLVLVG